MANNTAPDIETECPADGGDDLASHIEQGLIEKFDKHLKDLSEIKIQIRLGYQAAYLQCRVGSSEHMHQFDFFARNVPGVDFDGALGVLVDFLDGAMEQFFEADRDAYFPLDYTGHPCPGGHTVYARSTLRNLIAEEAADQFLKNHGEAELLSPEE